MGTLTALLVATPIWGFSLTPPHLVAGSPPLRATPPLAASLGPSILPAQVEAAAAVDAGAEPEADADEDGGGDDDYATMLRDRADLVRLHRPLGISTWISMGITLLLGGFQYHDLYGEFGELQDAPCVSGEGLILDQCTDTPWYHLSSAMLTTALYSATFTISLLMPDPDAGAEDTSEFGATLRMHKLLRWIHFGGMVTQVLLGIFVANAWRFGLDRANDFGTLQALATVHMGVGLVTYGALTWAGALMVF